MTVESQLLKLNLGCGHHILPGWINVDYALGARFAKFPFFYWINHKLKFFEFQWDRHIFIHDLRMPFPWEDHSIDIIYSSHTLEHFSKEDGMFFLKECYRVLKTGGTVRIVVPDLNILITRYIRGELRADNFIDGLVIRDDSPNDGYVKRTFAPLFRFPHKCLYDMEMLLEKMKYIGFDASGREPFESSISDIMTIETQERTKGVVIVEGKKFKEFS